MKTTELFSDFLRYAALNVAGMVGLSCYILADTFFVSRGLGTQGLAALNLALPIVSLVMGTGMMLGMGGAIQYAVHRGRDGGEQAGAIFTNTLFLALAAALVYVASGLFLSRPLTLLLGADQQVFAMTHTYLKVILLFSPAFILNHTLLAFVRNDGAPQLASLAMLVGSLSNVLLDYLFIFPLDMGIFGAVLATGIAPVISMAILLLHRLRRRNGFHLVRTRLHWKTARATCSLGFPSLVNELSSGIVMLVFNTLMLSLLGNVGVAAYGIVANLALVVIAVFTGVAQGAQPLISRSHGQGRPDLARRVLGYGLTVCLAMAGVIYILLALFAPEVAALFNSEGDPVLAATAVEGLRLYFLSAPLAGINIMAATYFAATQQALPAQLLSLLRGLFLVVPAALLLSALWGVCGLWLALPAAELATALACAVLFLRLKKS